VIGIDEVLSHHLAPQRRIIVDDQHMAHFDHVIIRAIVIPTSGSGRGAWAVVLKVVPRNCGLFEKRRLKPYIFLHIVDEERGTLPG